MIRSGGASSRNSRVNCQLFRCDPIALPTYRRAGVKEYVIWRTEDGEIDWWILEEDEYRRLQAGGDGVLRSRVFPGLWLETKALLARDGARLLLVLQQGLQSPEHKAFEEELARRSAAGI